MNKTDYLKREFKQNKLTLEPEDGRKPRREPNMELGPDPYEVELAKIEARIKAAKGLTEKDIANIEKTLAHQDIKKDIERSRMLMISDEAREKQKAHDDMEERKRKFREEFNAPSKNRDRER